MGVPAADATLIAGELLVLKIGPAQTLTFLKKPMGKAAHADLGEDAEGLPTNGGIHISMCRGGVELSRRDEARVKPS